jgi:hypothetical protein
VGTIHRIITSLCLIAATGPINPMILELNSAVHVCTLKKRETRNFKRTKFIEEEWMSRT